MCTTTSTSTKQSASVRRRNRHHILLGWCLWLIGSWGIAMAGESIKIASNLVMPFAAMIGMMWLWPMLRLSQWRLVIGKPCDEETVSTIGAAQLLGEWLSMNLVFQVVIWPLLFNAKWTVEQTVLLNSAMAGWSLLAGMITAWGCRSVTGWGRTLAMVLCLLVVLGEPAIMGLISTVVVQQHPGAGVSWTMRLSPIRLIWDLTRPFATGSGGAYGPQVMAVVVAAIVGWLALAMVKRGPDTPDTRAFEDYDPA